jgi:hypothetical protein
LVFVTLSMRLGVAPISTTACVMAGIAPAGAETGGDFALN